MEEVSTQRQRAITNHLERLIATFGPPRRPVELTPLQAAHLAYKHERMLYLIRANYELHDLRLRLAKVKNGGYKLAAAWVELPEPMPLYGTQEFRDMQLVVYAKRSMLERRIFWEECLIYAHELAHVRLRSLRHPLSPSERATDLTAMLFGYHQVYEIFFTRAHSPFTIERQSAEDAWRNSQGYLTSAEIQFAVELVRSKIPR